MAVRPYFTWTIRAMSVASFLSLCLVVGFVGVVATVASLIDTWLWLFRMEQVASTLSPVAVWLAVITVVTSIGAMLTIE